MPASLRQVLRRLIASLRTTRAGRSRQEATDPILSLAGTGKEIWADEDADAYVKRLREGWE